jgi:predicted dehydrogenase
MKGNKVLIIGCGNIGAQYDLKNNQIQTYAKALYSIKNNKIWVFDEDYKIAEQIGKHYGFETVVEINPEILGDFEIVIISSPTETHHFYLSICLQINVPVIICEKPISYSIEELIELENQYNNSTSKVLVNYFRSFLPAYKSLRKEFMQNNYSLENLEKVNISYKDGFVNNATHALNLINFLLDDDSTYELQKVLSSSISKRKQDFDISVLMKKVKSEVLAIAYNNIDYPLFEIEFYFQKVRVSITDSGDEIYIREYNDVEFDSLNRTKRAKHKCLEHYMKYTLIQAFGLFNPVPDNFISSLKLNSDVLKIILQEDVRN